MKRGSSYSGSSKRARGIQQVRAVAIAPRKSFSVRLQNFGPSARYSRQNLSRTIETKYFDTSQSFTVPSGGDWTGTEVTCVNYIQSDGTTVGSYTDCALIPSATGAGYGQVVGSQYHIRKLRCRGHVTRNDATAGTAATTGARVRVVLVMDTQPNGAQAQGEDVFTDMGASPQNPYAFMAMAAGAGGRFRILKDKWVSVRPCASVNNASATTVSTVYERSPFSFTYVPKKPLNVRTKASSSTPTVATLSDVNIFMLAIGTAAAVLDGCSRCYYCD